jgi:hypothetical protein
MKSFALATKSGGYSLNAEIDPEEVGQVLEEMGSFTTEDLLRAAKSKSSPLHKYFEWDDSKAAHEYRLHQARNLVLSIGFDYGDGITRTHESVVIDRQRTYVPIETISHSEELIEQVLKSALSEVLFWRAKHQKYKSFFGGIFDEIDKTEEALRRKNEKAAKGTKRGIKARNTANKKGNGSRNNNRRQPIAS